MKTKFLLLMSILAAVIATAQCPFNVSWNHLESTGLQVQFQSYHNAPAEWTNIQYGWSFGEGSASSEAHPSFTYAFSGTYPVCLTVTAEDGFGNTCQTDVCHTFYFGCPQVSVILSQEIVGDNLSVGWQTNDDLTNLSLDIRGVEVTATWDLTGSSVTKNITDSDIIDIPGACEVLTISGVANGSCPFYATTGFNTESAQDSVTWNLVMSNGVLWSSAPHEGCVFSHFALSESNISFQWPEGTPDTLTYSVSSFAIFNTLGPQTIYFWSYPYWSLGGCNNLSAGAEEFCLTVDINELSNYCIAQLNMSANDYTPYFTNNSIGTWTEAILELGDGQTYSGNFQSGSHVYAPGTQATATLTISNPQTGCYSSDSVTITMPEAATVCGYVFMDNNQNMVYGPGDTPVEGFAVQCNTCYQNTGPGYVTDSDGFFSLTGYPSSYTMAAFTSLFSGGNFSGYIPLLNTLSNDSIEGEGYFFFPGPGEIDCNNLIGLVPDVATYCGKVYHDLNNNGQWNIDEPGIPFAQIHLMIDGISQVDVTITTDANGDYCTQNISGYAHITCSVAGISLPSVPGSHNFTAGVNSLNENKNFGFSFTNEPLDWAVSLQTGVHVVGWPLTATVQLIQYGSATASGVVTLELPDEVSLIDATGNYTYTANPGVVQWTVTDIAPWSVNSFYLNLQMTDDLIGTEGWLVDTIASYVLQALPNAGLTDINLANNSTTQQVVYYAAYDPNNKLPNPPGHGPHGGIIGTETPEYTINFQNTGNAPAFNIWLKDTISHHLNLASLQVIQASHDFQMSITGREVTFFFPEIMLPDSATNEPESHGFVKYRIGIQPGLAAGTQITNTAYIYFDFNPAIVTNTTLYTIDPSLGVASAAVRSVQPSIFPNPALSYVFAPVRPEQSFHWVITDLRGAMVRQGYNAPGQTMIEFGRLSSGIYTLTTQTRVERQSHKLVVE